MSRELIERLRTPGVWVHHIDYSRAEPAGYVRDSAPFEAADALGMQARQIEQQAAEIERLRAALRAVYNAESRPEARAAIDAARGKA